MINTRADLDLLAGTQAHTDFMTMLAGSIWRLQKNDDLKKWEAVKDASLIERFDFTEADFPDATKPDLPAYVPPPSNAPSSVTMRQARLALLEAELLTQVNAEIDTMTGDEGEAAKIEWEYAQDVNRSSALVQSLAAALSLTEEQLDDLFEAAAKK
jgi:hypothetical protein